MTDRRTNYFGELIPETDNLQSQQFAMTGQAYQAAAFLGTGTVVDGFTCIPNTPAALNVILTPGSIYSLQGVEATTWSSLPANTTEQILKQGILHVNDVIGITPPGTVGFSQVFLIEAQYADLDTLPVLLPYFNSANPSQPFQGPNNNGQSQNTVRLGIASIQVKAGIAASTGTQVAPTPDAGFTGLFLVTVANGQATITAGNIAPYLPSSFIPTGGKLPQIATSFQNGIWDAFNDTGTADALVITPTPPSTAYVAGQMWTVKKSAAANATTSPTINVSGLGNKTIVSRTGATLAANDLPASAELQLIYDGTNFRNIRIVLSDLAGLSSLYNVQQFNTSTRVVMNGNSGNSFTVVGWSPGNYVKKSATSSIIVFALFALASTTGSGCAIGTLSVGGTTRTAPVTNSFTGTGAPNCAITSVITGLGAGNQAVTLSFSRSDSTTWQSSFCENNTDFSFLPPSTQATIIIGELGA